MSISSSMLRHEAARIAVANVGYGEKNSKFIAAIGGRPGDNWCAQFISYCYARAADNLDLPYPFMPARGGRELGRRIAAVGRKFTDPELLVVGDVVVYYRTALGRLDWRRHVRLVTNVSGGIYELVGGNESDTVKSRFVAGFPNLDCFVSLDAA